MWKIWKSIDIIRSKWQEDKNVLESLASGLASLRRDSACSESKTKMADGAEEVGFQNIIILNVFNESYKEGIIACLLYFCPCQIQEDEVFEITDFTTSSEWER